MMIMINFMKVLEKMLKFYKINNMMLKILKQKFMKKNLKVKLP